MHKAIFFFFLCNPPFAGQICPLVLASAVLAREAKLDKQSNSYRVVQQVLDSENLQVVRNLNFFVEKICEIEGSKSRNFFFSPSFLLKFLSKTCWDIR